MPSTLLSIEQREMGVGESIIFTADFTAVLSGDTLASVTSIAQLRAEDGSTTALTLGSGTVNAGIIEVEEGDEPSIAVGKAVQFRVTADAGDEGTYTLPVIVTTTDEANVFRMDCQLLVTA